jgi:hypothetical protein
MTRRRSALVFRKAICPFLNAEIPAPAWYRECYLVIDDFQHHTGD